MSRLEFFVHRHELFDGGSQLRVCALHLFNTTLKVVTRHLQFIFQGLYDRIPGGRHVLDCVKQRLRLQFIPKADNEKTGTV